MDARNLRDAELDAWVAVAGAISNLATSS